MTDNVCNSCIYYLERYIKGDEDREVRACMIDRYVFGLRDAVYTCNFYNGAEDNAEPPTE